MFITRTEGEGGKGANLRIDGEEELPLVSSDPGVSDSLDQLGVFVYQPGLPQHVGSSVLQLRRQTESVLQ